MNHSLNLRASKFCKYSLGMKSLFSFSRPGRHMNGCILLVSFDSFLAQCENQINLPINVELFQNCDTGMIDQTINSTLYVI